ncbi:MAG: acyl-CoA dehydrogenase family protein [Bdellovibrionales bacterium]|nr:acyl-CoA dehydrogenase family protein [Bdellovibrionales bacterium]
MSDFNSPNFFQTDDFLSEDEIMIRDSVRTFVQKDVLPIIGTHFENGTFPKDLIKKSAALGLLGAHLKDYGCSGVSPMAYGLIMQELERGDSGLRSFASVQGSLCMFPIHKYGCENLKNKYLPGMAGGDLIGCFGLTEPDFGSNPGGMITKAIKDGDDYIVNGNKMWITNGNICQLAIVWAKDENNDIIGIVIDKDTPGFTVTEMKHKFSLRASITSELHFQDCRVHKSQVLNVRGIRGPLSCLSEARYGIAWGVIGAAMACYDEALNYAKTRIQFNKPIASFQLVQAKLVTMITEITKAQLIAIQTARLKEAGKLQHQHISMAKMNNVSIALQIARLTRDILGANGITYEYQCARHLLNLESVNTYEGTEDIHRLIIGKEITGIAAFT